jgi:lysophospholipase L1-like esterase
MKSDKNIYIFFIALALVFWNPLTFYFVYGGTPVFLSTSIRILFWLAPISGICLIYLTWRNKLRNNISKMILSFAFFGIMVSFFVVADGLLGLSKTKGRRTVQGLIFEPNSKARYKTVEFDCVAEINSLGLRDKEIEVKKGDEFRILCFGDSWTFGWGVNVENSWPKKLECFFEAQGYHNIEVINCGQPGQYTSVYKKNMGKIVPLLRPDLVLVGVLQLDDLAQLYEKNVVLSATNSGLMNNMAFLLPKAKYSIKTFIEYSFGNILSIVANGSHDIVEVKSNWESSANSMINKFSYLQRLRFNALNDSVQMLFKTGDLNPGLLNQYINFPDKHFIFNNPNHRATQFAISEMKKDFETMQSICRENGSDLVFVNLPTNYFTGHKVIRMPLDIVNEFLYHNNKIDSIYRSVANDLDISYLELTDRFKALEDKNAYFFKYDGHPNEKGHEEIAKSVGQFLISENKLNIHSR